MPYTIEDFERDYFKKHFARLTTEEKLEVLKDLPPEQRLAGLAPEQLLAGLAPEQRLAGLTEEQIRQYLENLTAHRPARPPNPRAKKRPRNPEQQ